MAREPIDVRQSSFAAGEIAPTLHGQSDFKKFPTALRKCRNWWTLNHGSLVNRPGTVMVAEVKDSSKKVRLKDFIFSNGDALVLELGDQYVRFYKNGARIETGGNPVEVSTPYAVADIWDLKFAQSGDTITICHKSYQPRELKRLTADSLSWDLSVITYDPQLPSVRTAAYPGGTAGYNYSTRSDAGYDQISWNYVITLIDRNGRESVVQLPRGADDFNTARHGPDTNHPNGLGPEIWFYPPNPAICTPVLYCIYGGSNGLFGLIDVLTTNPPSTQHYKDWSGRAPDFTINPPTGDDPYPTPTTWQSTTQYAYGAYVTTGGNLYRCWIGGTSGGSAPTGQGADIVDGTVHWKWLATWSGPIYPTTVIYWEQRRIFGGAAGVLWASKAGQYYVYDDSFTTKADDAIQLILASQRYEEIKNFMPIRALLIMSGESEWLLSGAAGSADAFTATSFRLRQQSFSGSTNLQPIFVNNVVLHHSALGSQIRALQFDFFTDSYKSSELSILANHFFLGWSFNDWAYAKAPFGMIFMTREDGILIGLTYTPEQEVVGWHWHDTQGAFESVCAVPEGAEHATYVAVQRTINGQTKRFVERFASRLISKNEDGTFRNDQQFFLDCSKYFHGGYTSVTVPHLPNTSVMALIDGQVAGPYTSDANGLVDFSQDFPDGASMVIVGLPYQSDIELLDMYIPGKELRSNLKNPHRVSFEVIDSRGGLWMGQDFDNMTEWKQREVKNQYGVVVPFTGLDHVRFTGRYDHGGRVSLRQVDPLPITIVGIGREVDIGGS